MGSIHSLALKPLITKVVRNIFDTMLSMDVEAVEHQPPTDVNGVQIVGSVGFGGTVLGSLNLHVGQEFAGLMAAAMLGTEIDQIEDVEAVYDVIGEVCNMICGELKSRLCDAGLPCELSIPSITSGKNFQIDPRGWERGEHYGFRSNDHTALVAVFMKSVN